MVLILSGTPMEIASVQERLQALDARFALSNAIGAMDGNVTDGVVVIRWIIDEVTSAPYVPFVRGPRRRRSPAGG